MTLLDQIKKIHARLPQAIYYDRRTIYSKLKKIKPLVHQKKQYKKVANQIHLIEKFLASAIQKQQLRFEKRPQPTFPEHLPIVARKDEIIQTIKQSNIVIISGETGSGKSTQLPKMCIEAGCGIEGLIGCTQPRRIAAITLASRISEELGEDLGLSVGYKIRFQDSTRKDAYIKIVTDGILLAEAQIDSFLNDYDTLIIDEAHERSLNIDFILGILKQLTNKRPQLKVIIASATLDTEKFSTAFDHAPIIEVSGRMYPVTIKYMPPSPDDPDDLTYVDLTIRAVESLWQMGCRGDMLIFLPTEQDILETCDRLEGQKRKGVTIFPLFGRLSSADQRKVFMTIEGQKIVVATNVAETSLTIPGIKYVIDTGLARIPHYIPKLRITRLAVLPISKSSADQRKGRCGRVSNGVCIRLYEESDYESRPFYTPPEILRSNLAEVILRMMALQLGEIQKFPFIDQPDIKLIKDGYALLEELGALTKNNMTYVLTSKGSFMARMPIDPRISCMIIQAQKEGCVNEMAIIASALSIQDPRVRPLEKENLADTCHEQFKNPSSDFLTLLSLFQFYQDHQTIQSQNQLRKLCKTHYLSFLRMREWQDIYTQLTRILVEQSISITPHTLSGKQLYRAIHRSIVSGYLSNIGFKKQNNMYLTPKGREVMVFPGSGLFQNSGQWIVAAEMIETTRLFARTIANIKPAWIEDFGKPLCSYTYNNVRWDIKKEDVIADEQVNFYGLVIISKRIVSYRDINPELCNSIFIQSALVEGQINRKYDFMAHNQNVIQSIEQMENKLRRKDILVTDSDIFSFYMSRLKGTCNVNDLNRRIKQKSGDEFLHMSESMLLQRCPDDTELSKFPDKIFIGDQAFDCQYIFQPGQPDDGLTVFIPFSFIHELPLHTLEWLVPGMRKEKIHTLIKSLPKTYRKQLMPISQTVETIDNEIIPTHSPMITQLSQFIFERFQIDVPASMWSDADLPDYLKPRIAVIDYKGRVIQSERNIHKLLKQSQFGTKKIQNTETLWLDAKQKWEKKGITRWDFGDLPAYISISDQINAYIALVPGDHCVNIRLFSSQYEAENIHLQGVYQLYSLYLSKEFKFIRKRIFFPQATTPGVVYFGGSLSVENSIFKALTHTLFYKPFRTQNAFESYAKEILPHIQSKLKNYTSVIESIMNELYETRSLIHTLETNNCANALLINFYHKLRIDLTQLIPESFLDIYKIDRLEQLPRYLKGIQIRAKRGSINYDKEKSKASELQPFEDALHQLVKDITNKTTQDKRDALEDLYWMIEEYKLSLFAQEIKTSFPVSPKRLNAKIADIKRMI